MSLVIYYITRILKAVVFFAFIGLLFYAWNNYSCVRIVGTNMTPAISSDDFVLVKSSSNITRGDIVIFDYRYSKHSDDKVTRVARVIGLPGDIVKIDKGMVYVNGEKLLEEYVISENMSEDNLEEIIIPRDCYFILCDNRKGYSRDYDSRLLGPIGINSIKGKIEK
jgi:signal peptidase I